jgi:hypothetical protein
VEGPEYADAHGGFPLGRPPPSSPDEGDQQ